MFWRPTARAGRKTPAVAASVVLACFLAGPPLLATTVTRLGLEELIDAADTIVEGRVESTRSFWQGRQICTEVTVGVARALKGGRRHRLTLIQVGGRVDTPVPLACLDAGVASAVDTDPSIPADGSGFYYLVTGRNSVGEGSLGQASSGAPRPNTSPCP